MRTRHPIAARLHRRGLRYRVRVRRSVITALALALAACGGGGDDLDVRIDSGRLQGVYQGDARAFLGVPYAAPPVGDQRWRPPQPAPPFDGVFAATSLGIQCPQTFSLAGPGGEEDCLFLNVWAPRGGA